MAKTKKSATVRKNLTMPSDWWEAFEHAAASERISVSEWLGHAGMMALSPLARRMLSLRNRRGRPAKEAK